jgi:hypothetical protein
MNQCFVFSILRSRWTAYHAGEDFVKFGDRSDNQIENSGNPSTYWRQGRTDCGKGGDSDHRPLSLNLQLPW